MELGRCQSLVCMAAWMVTVNFPGSLSYPEIKWSSTPGNVSCLANTDVIFNWTHTSVPHPINIAWFYWGPVGDRSYNYILGYDNSTVYVPKSEHASRVEYDDFPGSAVMIMRNVTPADGGLYEAKVAVIDPGLLHAVPYISDTVTLTVINEEELRLTVMVGDGAYRFSVAENGTKVTLPDTSVKQSKDIELSVTIDSQSPEPTSISMEHHIGPKQYVICNQTNTCEMRITMIDMNAGQGHILIGIVFDIQNLDSIQIMATLNIETTTYWRTTGIIIGVLLVVIIIVLAVCSYRKCTKRCSWKTYPISKCRTQQAHTGDVQLLHKAFHYGADERTDTDYLEKDSEFKTYKTLLGERYLVPFQETPVSAPAEYLYKVLVNPLVQPKGSSYACHIRMIINGLQNSCGGKVAIICKKCPCGGDQWKAYIPSILLPNVERATHAGFVEPDETLIACLIVHRRKGSVFVHRKAGDPRKFVMFFLMRDDGSIDNIGGWRRDNKRDTRGQHVLEVKHSSWNGPAHVPSISSISKQATPSVDRQEQDFGPQCSRSFAKSIDDTTKESNVARIHFRDMEMFQLTKPMRFTPPKTELENEPKLKNAISDIEELSHKESFAIVCSDITYALKESFGTKMNVLEDHLADTIHMDTGPVISLISLYGDNTEKYRTGRKERTFILARLIMKRLTEHAKSEKQIYVYPLTHSAGEFEDARERTWSCSVGEDEIKDSLGHLLLQDTTGFKDRFNSEITVHLAREQVEAILGLGMRKFSLIEGAPGTGKTLLEQYFCERHGKDQCAILCQSTGVTEYIKYQGKADAHKIPEDINEAINLIRVTLGRRKFIIIDDAQYIAWSENTWTTLFKKIAESHQHVYVFMDSRYQMYKCENTAEIIGSLVGKELGLIMPMMRIHRNSKVVFEYMKTHASPQQDWTKMECVSSIDGDDAKMSRVPDVQDLSGKNGLLTFVKSLARYRPTAIAILFDAGNTKPGHEKMRQLFSKEWPESMAQKCDKFPVEGIVIDSIDNFLGLDAPCVIMVLGQSSDLKNMRYVLTIASRAVKRLEFVKLNFSEEETKLLNFQNAPIEERHISPKRENNTASVGVDMDTVATRAQLDHRIEQSHNNDQSVIEMEDVSQGTQPDRHAELHQKGNTWDFTVRLFCLFDVSCEPNSVMELPSGQILVTDFHHGQIYLLTKDLQPVKSFNNNSVTPSAAGVVRDGAGNIYVAEQVNDTLTVYDSQYNLSRQITNDTIEDDNYMTGPLGLVLTKENLLYFCDSRNHRIQVRALDGTFVATFGKRGRGPGDFKHHPCFIDVSDRGLVAVTDRGGRLYLFTPDGGHTYKHKPFKVDPSLYIKQARGVTFHPSGNIIVADTAGKLLVLTVEGELVSTIGEPGEGLGQLGWPRDLCVTKSGHIIVCEKENHRVQMFEANTYHA